MKIHIRGAREHNLQGVDVELGEGLTVVTGISGSGKTSLVFDTLYHEARRRFLEVFELGSPKGRLAPANVDAISGLGPAVAVGQNLLNRNPNSTLATASGLHPFLRLLYAHFGERSCPRCGMSLVVYTEDEILERLAELAGSRTVSIAAALVHEVPGSHRTLLGALAERFGLERVWVDGMPWSGEGAQGTAAQSTAAQNTGLAAAEAHDIDVHIRDIGPGTDMLQLRAALREVKALGAQAVAVRWEGQTQRLARAPVCIRCGAWFGDLRPVDFHKACPHCNGQGCQVCHGTGLMPQAAAAHWAGLRFPEFLQQSVDEALGLFTQAEQGAATARLRTEISQRLKALQRVGLGYVGLDRPVPSLSRGEAQRVRLALTLISRLEDMLHVLDEPTVGQHPADIQRLLPALRELAGPVVFVEHERMAAAGADRAIELGPGAGRQGGRVVFQGTPEQLWQADTATGQYFSQRKSVLRPEKRSAPEKFLTIRGANLRNLQNIDVPIPIGRLSVVTGVSGSGKSTLVEDVLAPSLANRKPSGCRGIDGPPIHLILVDQSPIGRNPRSNPATYTKLSDVIRDLFAAVTGLPAAYFSFNRPEGACGTCGGLGAVEVGMRYLPSTWIPCAECEGLRFTDTVLAAKIQAGEKRYSIAEFYELKIDEVKAFFSAETRLAAGKLQTARQILEALCEIGLGYLTLGQASTTLSGGEAQRVKLARYLGKKSLAKNMLVLDEPTTGLHPQDLSGLLGVLDRLVRAGATIVVVEHNTDVIRAADWVIDLGPGAGPAGGRLLYAGPPEKLAECSESVTGQALSEESRLVPAPLAAAREHSSSQAITIRGARVHNLRDVSVAIPKGKLTVVTGLSGSGKSSLVHDVLEAEARRRFLESLSLYERQGLHEGAEADVEAVTGLGVALTVDAERLVFTRRATVGTATEIAHHLAALLASQGERQCLECGSAMRREAEWVCDRCGARAPLASARHFSPSTYAAACQTCNGVGSLQAPNPSKLIIHPDKPLVEGAMYSPGFFPNGYLGKPFNGGYYMLRALAEHYGFDPHATPWNEISAEAQQAFLFGSKMELTITYYSRAGRSNTYQAKFPGFYGFIRDWDVGGTYSDTRPCPACGGRRLRPEYLAVRLGGSNVYELEQMTLVELAQRLAEIAPARGELASALDTVRQRLGFLIQVGLGYLNLERVAGTLSAGEAQRIRLASLLGSGLTALTVLLDEPTRGLHPTEVEALLNALEALRDEGNTVIVVEHDPQVMRCADHLIDMGPGAGQNGGQIVAQGTPEEVAQCDSHTGRWLRGERRMEPHQRREPQGWLAIRGARANNLKGERIEIPLGVLAGVCGVSGSGKSTLVVDTLGRALAPKKQTTSVAYEPVDPGEYEAIEGAPPRTIVVDQSKAGLGSAATFLDLARPIQAIYAASPEAQVRGLSEAQLSERCSACDGRGRLTLDMTFLPDVHVTCETCRGSGYTAEAWEVRLNGLALPEVFGRTIDEVYRLFGDDERLGRPLQAAREVGLGYLVLSQPGYALSGGEAQRLKIAGELRRKSVAGSFYILDEPSIGQHLEDVLRLTGVLHRLVDEGGSALVVEHHTHILAACDWLMELGPGGGPGGGHVIATGTPEKVAAGNTPTAAYLRGLL
ncbi:MAG: excinuclease ABC subunit UvrA [Chloroflexota bacterium]|nr:MAG: excinuclease ABC subunit UvrA [Chloroflexota bacterium]